MQEVMVISQSLGGVWSPPSLRPCSEEQACGSDVRQLGPDPPILRATRSGRGRVLEMETTFNGFQRPDMCLILPMHVLNCIYILKWTSVTPRLKEVFSDVGNSSRKAR